MKSSSIQNCCESSYRKQLRTQKEHLRTGNVAGTSEAAPLVKEASDNAVKASRIVRAAKLAENLGAASVINSLHSRNFRNNFGNEQLT